MRSKVTLAVMAWLAVASIAYTQQPAAAPSEAAVVGEVAGPKAAQEAAVVEEVVGRKAAKDMDPTAWLLADKRAVERAALDPLFAELAVTDPKLAAVVLSSQLPLPLEESFPGSIDRLRQEYDALPPPLTGEYMGSGYPPWSWPANPIPYRGTVVMLQQPDDPLAKQVVESLKKLPVPAKRSAFYAKLWKELRHIGWNLSIMRTERVDGAIVVHVSASPLATAGGRHATVMTTVQETYEFKNNKLKLLKVETPPASKGMGYTVP